MYFSPLKERHRKERDQQSEGLALRIHRALSWLHRAEMADDDDARFIFLWIAFNAAYAQEIDDSYRQLEHETFKQFLQKICDLDTEKKIDRLVWDEFSGPVRILLDSPFVLHGFWEFQRGNINEEQWQDQLRTGKQIAQQSLASGNTASLLCVIFGRLYTLRNQLIHGGATWSGKVNRNQLRDSTRLLHKLIPLIIEIMMDNPNTLWGEACFPVVRDM